MDLEMGSSLDQWDKMSYINHAPKKEIETKIYKDFFTKDELSRIYNAINEQKKLKPGTDFYAPGVQAAMSRVHIEIKYPEDILKKVEDFASKLCGERVVLTHNSYYHYSKEYNPEMETPILKPHRDFDNYYSKLTLDYQLDKNVDWDIIIEDQRYSLEFGDMLAFWGAGLIHWRENIILEDNQSTSVLTLHFSNEEDHKNLNSIARSTEEREKRRAENKKDEVWTKYTQQWEEERENFINRKGKG